MAVSGRKGRTVRKLQVKESISGAKGFTNIVFAHKASMGDTFIDVNYLNEPTVEMPTFSNPSATRIIEARMYQFKKNVTVISSLQGILIQDLSYVINSNYLITFKDFTAANDEIFTVIINASPISGLQVVDARTPHAEGDLLVGETDFYTGFGMRTIKNDIVVYRNGIEQRRNTNNSDSVLDGNYYVYDADGDTYGLIVRFNDATVVDPDYIRVVGVGGTVESPGNSTWDEMESLQGQIDALVPTVADLAGVPETNFQGTPNNIDLKEFGDRVLDLEQGVNDRAIERAKAWLYSDGTGTIGDSYGIASVVRNSDGDYTVTFSDTFASFQNYAISISTSVEISHWSNNGTNSIRVHTKNLAGTSTDAEFHVIVFGRL